MNINRQHKAALDKIAADHGGTLKPAHVVAAAKKSSSPLHGLFEWNDAKAANQFRLAQARQIVQVYVEMLPGVGEARSFVALRSNLKEGGGYMRTDDLLANPVTRDQLVRQFAEDVEAVVRRYAYLRLIAPDMFAAIERAVKATARAA